MNLDIVDCQMMVNGVQKCSRPKNICYIHIERPSNFGYAPICDLWAVGL